MPPPKPKKLEQEAFDKLININTALHGVMADLTDQSVITEDAAMVPAELIKKALGETTLASQTLGKFPQLKKINEQVDLWGTALQKVLATIPEEEGKLSMPAVSLSTLNHPVINQIANLVHNAAVSLIGATKELKACQVKSFKPDEAVFINKYCSGAIPGQLFVHEIPLQKISIEGKEKVLTYETQIEHKLGLHRVKPSSMTTDQINLAIEYRDSSPSYSGSSNRMRGVRERLEKLGLECYIGTKPNLPYSANYPVYCWGNLKPDTIRTMATFFSLLLDGDIYSGSASKGAHEVVRDKVWEVAEKLNSQYGDDTWTCGIHKPNWSQMLHEWQEEKELYTKKVIYEDLRNLLILRDKHHGIETEYDIDEGKGSIEGMEKIVANAKQAMDIIKKNNWGGGHTASAISTIQGFINQGKAIGITAISDGIGNEIHMIVVNKLVKEGTYGGCPMSGKIININAGNLAYCEGVLKGTDAVLSVAGNEMNHKVLPKSYRTYIGDEHLHKGYNIVLDLPKENGWSEWLKDYIGKNFDCHPDGKCFLTTPSLDFIRQMALFISNLRGCEEKIGAECAVKAIEAAEKASTEQNKKDVFAFTQEPIMPSTKAWIDMCHKQYGILPPGLTEEEKIIMQLIGPNKLYGGCGFTESEIIPNMGIVKYCEGVRRNPVSSINAQLNPAGYLDHFFHTHPGAPDRIAELNIVPEGKFYHVELKDIDMRGEALQEEVISRLKTVWNFKCPSKVACSSTTPFNEDQLRFMAAFLSSLHQAYKLDEECTKAAVDYVLKEIFNLPSNVDAHDTMVYPFEVADWNKAVCSKIEAVAPPEVKKPPVVEKPPSIKLPPVKITPVYIEKQIPPFKPSPPFGVGGCVSTTAVKPTLVKAAYCSGILTEAINKFGTKGTLTGTGMLGTTENWQQVYGDAKIVFDSKLKTLYITLPDELIVIPEIASTLEKKFGCSQKGNTFKRTFEYLPYFSRIALFFSHLANITQIPEDCRAKAVEYAFSKSKDITIEPVYPLEVESWMKEVCAPEKVMTYAELDADTKKEVYEFMKKEKLAGNEYAIKAAELKFNIPTGDPDLMKLYDFIMAEIKAKEKKPKPAVSEVEEAILKFLKEHSPQGHTFESIGIWLYKHYDVTDIDIEEVLNIMVEEGKIVFEAGYYKLVEKPPKEEPTASDIIEAPWLYTLMQHVKSPLIVEIDACFNRKLANITGIQALHSQFCKELVENITWQEEQKVNIEIFKTLWDECLNEVAGIKKPEEKPSIVKLEKEAFTKVEELLKKLPVADIDKAHKVKEYKKLPTKIKEHLHAYMNWLLIKNLKDGIPYTETIKQLVVQITKVFDIPITPLMVKLQTDIEKKKKVRKGEFPAEPGEKVPKYYIDLPFEEQAAINDKIQDLLKEDKGMTEIIKEVMDEFGIGVTGLEVAISTQKVQLLEEEKPPVDLVMIATLWDYPDIFPKDIPEEISKCMYKTVQELNPEYANPLHTFYPVDLEGAADIVGGGVTVEQIKEAWIECIGEYAASKMIGKKVNFPELSGKEQEQVGLFAIELAKKGWSKENIIDELSKKYNLDKAENNYPLESLSGTAVSYIKSEKEGFISADVYKEPWKGKVDWFQIPMPIALCMSRKLKEVGAMHGIETGVLVPFSLKTHETQTIKEKKIAALWAECVEEYEAKAGIEWKYAYENLPPDKKEEAESALVSYGKAGLSYDQIMGNMEKGWNLVETDYLKKEIEAVVELFKAKKSFKEQLLDYMKSQLGIPQKLADVHTMFATHSEGEILKVLMELHQEGKLAYSDVEDAYLYTVTPEEELAEVAKMLAEKEEWKNYDDLNAVEQAKVATYMAVLIEQGYGLIQAVKSTRELYKLNLKGLGGLYDKLKAEHKAEEKGEEELKELSHQALIEALMEVMKANPGLPLGSGTVTAILWDSLGEQFEKPSTSDIVHALNQLTTLGFIKNPAADVWLYKEAKEEEELLTISGVTISKATENLLKEKIKEFKDAGMSPPQIVQETWVLLPAGTSIKTKDFKDWVMSVLTKKALAFEDYPGNKQFEFSIWINEYAAEGKSYDWILLQMTTVFSIAESEKLKEIINESIEKHKPGEPKPKYFMELTEKEKEEIEAWMTENCKGSVDDWIDSIHEEFYLVEDIHGNLQSWVEEIWQEAEKKVEPKSITELSDNAKEVITHAIYSKLKEGLSIGQINTDLLQTYHLIGDNALFNYILETLEKWEAEKPEFWSITTENFAALKGFSLIVKHMWEEGSSEFEIKSYLNKTYHLEIDDALMKFVNAALEEIGVTTVQKEKRASEKTKAEEEEEEKALPPMPKDELLQWLTGWLVNHPGAVYVADELSEVLSQHPKYESPGVIPVGDALVELAKSGVISAEYTEPYTFWYEEKKEEKPPELPPLIDEDMTSFIKMGWTAEAVVDFFSFKAPPELLKKKADKLYKLYKPETFGLYTYDAVNPAVKGHLEKIAAKMLSWGKSQEDTAWYIHYNYAIDKASLKPMVKKIAEKPLAKVEAAVEAIKEISAGKIGGCKITQKPEELTAQTVAYCQGVLEDKAVIKTGKVVTHEVDSIIALLESMDSEKSWGSSLEYIENGEAGNWETRLAGVEHILTEMFGECDKSAVSVICHMKGEDGKSLPIADQDRLRTAAIFISSIENVDKLDKACIPQALKYAREHAVNINQTSKPWSVTPFPNTVEDWDKIVCSKML